MESHVLLLVSLSAPHMSPHWLLQAKRLSLCCILYMPTMDRLVCAAVGGLSARGASCCSVGVFCAVLSGLSADGRVLLLTALTQPTSGGRLGCLLSHALYSQAAECGPFCPERRALAGSTTASCLCHTYRSMHKIVFRSLYTHCLLFGRCGDRAFVMRTLLLLASTLALAASHSVSVIEV